MLFMAVPPVELEWPARRELYAGTAGEAGDAYDRMIGRALQVNDTDAYEFALYGCVADRIADRFGTRGAPVSLHGCKAQPGRAAGSSGLRNTRPIAVASARPSRVSSRIATPPQPQRLHASPPTEPTRLAPR